MSERALIVEAAITVAIWAAIALLFPALPLLAVIMIGIPLGYLVCRGGPALVHALRDRRRRSTTVRE